MMKGNYQEALNLLKDGIKYGDFIAKFNCRFT